MLTSIMNKTILNNMNNFIKFGVNYNIRRKFNKQEQENNDDDCLWLMDIPRFEYPGFIRPFYNYYYMQFKIPKEEGQVFNLFEFMKASKQAISIVSKALSKEDYESLEGLVTDSTIEILKKRMKILSPNHKRMIALEVEDIQVDHPYEIIYDGDEKNGQLSIWTLNYYFQGYTELQRNKMENLLQEHPMDIFRRIMITNYRFIRKYKNGEGGSYTIDAINHFPK